MTAPAPTPQREYAFLHAPILAFYSRPLYRDVAHHWRGYGAAYLLLVAALVTLPQALRVHVAARAGITDDVLAQVSRIPPLRVEGGQLRLEATQPLTLLQEGAGDDATPVIVVDTTGTLTTLDGSSVRMLLLKDHVLTRQPDGTVESTPLAPLEGMSVDGPLVTAAMLLLRNWGAVMFFLLAVVLGWLLHVLQAAIMGFITRMLAARLDMGLTYDVAMRLTAVAMTPALLANAFLDAMDVAIPGAFLVWALMTLGYVNLSIQAVVLGDPPAADED
ncbi:MAG: DUF1189 family protein [Deltaproteobacteria bacterium]|nr:DUF1189 family protein [Deltaproteobacteria bacterium]